MKSDKKILIQRLFNLSLEMREASNLIDAYRDKRGSMWKAAARELWMDANMVSGWVRELENSLTNPSNNT